MLRKVFWRKLAWHKLDMMVTNTEVRRHRGNQSFSVSLCLCVPKKNRVLPLAAFSILLLFSCTSTPKGEFREYTGPAQGTSYHISCIDPDGRNLEPEIQAILADIDQSLSIWHKGSVINQFNQADSLVTGDEYFLEMLRQSRQIYELTHGVFDPTVMPLVRAWGFGPDKAPEIQTDNPDSLLALVNYAGIHWKNSPSGVEGENIITKASPAMQVDFNAIAQGYTVDVLADLLESRGIHHFMVELGGEVRTRGVNPDGKPWTLGIEQPLEIEGITALAAVINLKDRGLATSGSYKKFYVKDGIKYSHTIDPFTGRPVTHTLLSVTVLAETAAKADAFATAFMVWGLEKSQQFLRDHAEQRLDVYFISASTGDGWEIEMTEGMEEVISR